MGSAGGFPWADYRSGTNSRTFWLPRAWVTINVIPEHFHPSAVRSSVWV
jgi:hypothetical protein